MSDNLKNEALSQAKETYGGFITFIKWISFIWIALTLVMCSQNFLDDPTASQSDPSWKEEYLENMGINK